MLVPASSEPIGDELEVVVPLDTSLAPSGAFEGDVALLIDPGATPSGDGPGRPRSVIRQLELRGFDGSSVRLFVPHRGVGVVAGTAQRVGSDTDGIAVAPRR